MNFLFDEFLSASQRLMESRKSFVIVTLVDKKNSVPQDIGSKMIVCEGVIYFGTIGGGALEKSCIEEAINILNDDSTKSLLKQINLNRDLGMTCGGSATVFFEKIAINNSWKIAVFGAGHVSQALCRILVNLDCNITCIDTRKEWLDKLPNTNKLNKIFVENYTDYIKELSYDSFIVITTSGHKFDYPILKEVLQIGTFPYIGVIGSKIKRARFDFDLKKENIKENFFCPIGENFGTNNPNEIAISITAQLLKCRDTYDYNIYR
ncbi:xanthine dehydrogenase accessory protein XdhC [Arcobacter defluvii]|uniref:Xanthine dehydrogenase maturation factor n=1 Tax=Arcobacter defluvii TaxID=873191 RepID=A0AAE7BDC2_9BACT|nr:xanthine dehydrogenase accessory protein XdhC [Arcobacter defluvii]QKF77023.1 xanthine dehydrogenase maturation factor [Arcobacter defluvii]RXI29803.1 xanthine dehydrogenase accessory protein XdhC [Arcobacter defluvii]